MLKKIIIPLLILFVASLVWAGMRFFSNPTQLFPYPYKVALENELESAGDIVIIGDRLGTKLSDHLETWEARLSKGLRNPLKIINLAADKEGLHRSLAKLKRLKKFPAVVIYLGGSEEFYEDKYDLYRNYKTFQHNMKIYQSDFWQSVMMLAPALSRLIYQPYHYVRLDSQPKADKKSYPPAHKQLQIEMGYNLFNWELEELIALVKEKNSTLIMITPPINLNVPPQNVCSNSSTVRIREEQQEIEKLLAENPKEALESAAFLANVTVGNARSFYLLGKAYQKNGSLTKAKGMYYRAGALDCSTWRNSIVINKTILEKGSQSDIPVIDFNQMVNKGFTGSSKHLFKDQIYPREKFYRKLFTELDVPVRKVLKL